MADICIGIDPSANKLAMCCETPLYMETRTLGKRFTPQSCAEAMNWSILLLSRLPRDYKIYAFLEAPLVARGRIRSTIVQAHVSGAVQAALASAGSVVYLVHPSTWKTALTGKPTASKEEVSGFLEAQWPKAWQMASGDGDLVDAAALALYGRDILARGASVA